jgi:hypothetical protein
MRRLQQHNGERSGGAKATRGLQWNQAFYISGFPSWKSALQFEWAWKYYSRGKYGVAGKIDGLITVIGKHQCTSNALPFNEWNTVLELVENPAFKGYSEPEYLRLTTELFPFDLISKHEISELITE